jgi:RNA-splicing ligase RtcB
MGALELKGKYCKDIKIFTDNIEEEALSTIYKMAESMAYKNKKIRIMPDVHQGKGCVIGFSCPIDIEHDFVSPEVVGCDLGCTVSAVFFDREVPKENIAELEHKIRKNIPFGVNINDKSKIDVKLIIKRFNAAQNRLCSFFPIFSDYRINFENENDLKTWTDKFHMDYGVFMKSIGSVGSGNHYLEYDVNDELGKYCICVHCGSRNLGLKVFNYWNKIAKSMTISKEEMRMLTDSVKSKNTDKKKLDAEIKAAKEEYLSKKIPGYLSGENLMGYLVDVLLAQEYARLNHETIIEQVVNIYRKMAKGVSVVDTIHTTHNYIDYDLKALMGKPNMMIRKGAIRAYEGERVIIPFNMRDGISICEGKSNEDWNFTAPHGAGRIMSRSAAKQNLDVEEFQKQMADAGIYTTTADKKTIDEAPNAYKPMEEIVRYIEPTVNILYFMKPMMNIKASDTKEHED